GCRSRARLPDERVEHAHGIAQAALSRHRCALHQQAKRARTEPAITREPLGEDADRRLWRHAEVAAEPRRGELAVALEHARVVARASIERGQRVDERAEAGRLRL